MIDYIKKYFSKINIKLVILLLLLFFVFPLKHANAFWSAIFAAVPMFGFSAIIGLAVQLLGILSNFVLGGILWVAGIFFEMALTLSTKQADIVEYGWGVSLQLANMFFIIILLAIAIGTILDLPTINLKKSIPKFLMVSILINFSMVIGGIILDASNVFALFFNDTISGGGLKISEALMGAMGLNIVKSIDSVMAGNLVDPLKNLLNLYILIGYQIIIQLSAIFVLLAGAVYMISRTFWLWTLLMIAPLAWIALIIPGQEKHWKAWWDKFIKWSLFAPVFLFFTYLALLVASKAVDIFSATENTDLGQSVGGLILEPKNIIQLSIVVFLMFFGIIAADKMGVGGSNFIVSGATSAGGAAKKRFSELRGKTPLSPENIGKKFGTFGAAITTFGGRAPLGVGRQYKETMAKERFTKARELHETASYAQLLGTYTSILASRTINPDQAAQIKELISRPEAERVANGIPANLNGNINDLRLAVRAGMRGDTTF